jgi:hypothetical protein
MVAPSASVRLWSRQQDPRGLPRRSVRSQDRAGHTGPAGATATTDSSAPQAPKHVLRRALPWDGSGMLAFKQRLSQHLARKAWHYDCGSWLAITYYNFCRGHRTLGGRTPAQTAGLAPRRLELGEVLGAALPRPVLCRHRGSPIASPGVRPPRSSRRRGTRKRIASRRRPADTPLRKQSPRASWWRWMSKLCAVSPRGCCGRPPARPPADATALHTGTWTTRVSTLVHHHPAAGRPPVHSISA